MKLINRNYALLGLVLLASCTTLKPTTYETKTQGGGMWIPTEVNEVEMKKMGMKLNVNQLFNNQTPALNHAVAQFNKGCTSELISSKGLLLTNHHCGFGEIQSHSTLKNDYITNGFWAYNLSEELPNKNTTATFYTDIQEVTTLVNEGITDAMSETQKRGIREKNIENLKKSISLLPYQEIEIKSYYDGNKYYKLLSETFTDVRLVGAPPASIGKFGNDTDNWVWPRHTGDFSLFRVYADKNNNPAPYAPDNVPYKPKKYLSVSIKGVKEGDFTMVYGFPGKTQEYLPASALENITQEINPAAISVRETALGILDKEMRKNNETRIKYASKYARISNYHKKWIGENIGIKKSGAIDKKKKYEQEFLTRSISSQPKNVTLLPELNTLYAQQANLAEAKTYYDEVFNRNSETFRLAQYFVRLNKAIDLSPNKAQIKTYLQGFYKDYNPILDADVTQAIFRLYHDKVPSDLQAPETNTFLSKLNEAYNSSFITGNALVNGANILTNIDQVLANDELLKRAIQEDQLIHYVQLLATANQQLVTEPYEVIQKQIDVLQKKYMQAQLETFPERKIFPDANSTLRITYGKVSPYPKGDGTMYPYKTYASEIMKKYIPNDYEFDVSPKLQQLIKNQDYGPYAEGVKMPVNFIASNHTTGGNSGSPALDGEGNLIGLNFDRVWEGTMSDLYYDPTICRNIMVDARYILFIIDKYANAQNLLEEIDVVK